jgi:hypothetical protein
LDHLQSVRGAKLGRTPVLKVLPDIVPKAAIVRIDRSVIVFSPYAVASRTSSWWVLEVRAGCDFFDTLNSELEAYLARAEPYEPAAPPAGD